MSGGPGLVLFGTGACHLCEQALGLLQPWVQRGWSVEQVDIATSDELFQRYGLIIPVLRAPADGRELNWPFDAESLGRFLAEVEAP